MGRTTILAAESCIHSNLSWPKFELGPVRGTALALFASIFGKRGRQREASRSREASDEETARRVLQTYGNAILRLAYSYLHNKADAEEVLQDTLVRHLQKAPSFEDGQHEKAWLLTVAANLSKNKIKYEKRRETDELMEELTSKEEEDLSFVWEAAKALPDSQREAIHLHYLEGYSTKEIAEILGRNESTVRSDLLRGRQKLGEVLKESYGYE